ncbi:MAG TPA: hypothetical protein PLI23_10720 [Thermoclostridium caenicola]|uniref:hypothetical protein n=1 Tax=Thermoclostridium caenicola TaxID=659425 RepID=UPI002B57DB60|nr:hypothetical protein [Thermoclostridium caenicola]HPO77626.1 hypothetical protein [Thermoclostridium caenicola]
MRVRVILPFKDKHTKKVYQPGQAIEVTEERYEELASAALGPFVETVEQGRKEVKAEKKPENKATKKTTKKAKK